jgi:hypothetical protein
MRYRDLIEFEPIETVIKLVDADDKRAAEHLVDSYVISERMADQLVNLILPQLSLDRPIDTKGIFIVGNYGTGKSHLMSVISALAEHADLAQRLRHPAVCSAALPIAGKFRVIRTEIGGVQRSLRDIVLDSLSTFLAEQGTPYSFPPADQLTNNKQPIIQALAGFNQKYPDTGILFVLDELLDYLRSREERQLLLDLGFLREIGEVTAATPFRFVAGIQEVLFDNPRFGFVNEKLRQIRDRFEQIRIAREDIAFVVAQRLLHKNDQQLARVTEHLRPFGKFYPPLSERLTEFAHMFPIHPSYIETFERVYVAEKREVLKTFSHAIRSVLDQEVPTDQTGIISYDHYWGLLRNDPSLRTAPGISDVVDKSNVLEGRIQHAYTRKHLLPMALRIIHALSIHRLTTSDINAPLGVTAEELRDELCLWADIPEPTAEFLLGQVQSALKEMIRTVSGQFLSFNHENGQYFLDLKKVIDFDARISERGRFMEERDLNRYFYDALRTVLNLSTSVHVTGFLIWEYEVAWEERRVGRPGYLLFGPPGERSTAQPPRDCYIYIIPPFGPLVDKKNWLNGADEVYFQLQGLDSSFEELVRNYAGALVLSGESPDQHSGYRAKSEQYLRQIVNWLRLNLNQHLRISHKGTSRSVVEILARSRSSAASDIEELFRQLTATILAPEFAEQYPDYPAFTRLNQVITERTRSNGAADAIRFMAGRPRTALAIAVLDGLKLLDINEHIKPLTSPYAQHLLNLLQSKAENQVVNQGEVLVQVAGGTRPIYKDPRFQLEPEWIAVLLTALTYDGQIVLNLGGNETLDAGNIEQAALHSIDKLTDFRFYRRPKSMPLVTWVKIFEGLGLQVALIRDEQTRTDAVQKMVQQVQNEAADIARMLSRTQAGLVLWNQSLITTPLLTRDRDGLVAAVSSVEEPLSEIDVLPAIRSTKEFLEKLSRFNTPGKLQNLDVSLSGADDALEHRARALRVRDALAIIDQLQPLAAYLSEASAIIPAWRETTTPVQQELLNDMRRLIKGAGTFDVLGWQQRLGEFKRAYIQRYSALHEQAVLGPSDADRRAQLLNDSRIVQLDQLSKIDILNEQELQQWLATTRAIPACHDFHAGLLQTTPLCPRCHFRPMPGVVQSAQTALATQAAQLDILLIQWQSAVKTNLASDIAQASLSAMKPGERQLVQSFIEEPAEPTPATVKAINSALRGISALVLPADELLAALANGGWPCTLDELRQRFESYLQTTMRGKDARSTRITLGQPE